MDYPRQGSAGSIPASAGEPAGWPVTHQPDDSKVYPRECGGTEGRRWPSPSKYSTVYPRECGGTTPSLSWQSGVYPRECGGTCIMLNSIFEIPPRSIPASAGEPSATGPLVISDVLKPVYPRECGGTARTTFQKSDWTLRSIPASAGEPSLSAGLQPLPVYPRECGGTGPERRRWYATPVLTEVYPRECGGTLPDLDLGLSSGTPVYPRECGGTVTGCLSANGKHTRTRSIPASAGEPSRQGTGWKSFADRVRGLSPRVRGNRNETRNGTNGNLRMVYPRECGGTFQDCDRMRLKGRRLGLSPRVRGNPRQRWAANSANAIGLSPRVRGNLDNRRLWRMISMTVYPRECGGTRETRPFARIL